jgi:hypothetical protein
VQFVIRGGWRKLQMRSSLTKCDEMGGACSTHGRETINAYYSLVGSPKMEVVPSGCKCRWEYRTHIKPLEPSGNCVYHLLQHLVTLHFDHSVCMPLVTVPVQTAIISLNSVNRLIFVTVKSCVFFAVRTEFLNII